MKRRAGKRPRVAMEVSHPPTQAAEGPTAGTGHYTPGGRGRGEDAE